MASTKTENKNTDVSKTENKAEIVVNEITQEETNFLRIALLLRQIAPAAVRTKFDAEFSPQRLEKTLQQEKFKTLEPLRRKKVITEKQWELLFPNAGSPCSTTFDSTLMICLLRNLANISVGDKLPVTNDRSVAADLSRIKHYRNIVFHSGNESLTDHTFQQYWDDISQAIVRLGGNSFEQKCREMKVTNLDNKTELLNMERPSDPIPVGVKFIQCKIIDEWKTQEKKLVETRAIKHLAELIESEDVVTVIGSSGSGKSTAVHHVALQLIYRGYEIVPVKTPEQMLQYFNHERKQVFVVDDVCGIATIDINKVNSWVEHQLEIEKMLKEKRTKILTSCRSYIFQQRHFKSIKAFSLICHLNELNYSLTPTERQKIAQQYLSEQEVQLIKNYGLLSKFDFFPLLCKLYSRQSSGDIVSFFDNPVKIIRDELTLLKEANDQTTLATLYLFVVYNNSIDENQLSGNSEIKDVLTRISEEFEFSSIFSLRVVKSQLENFTSSFVEKSSCYYRIIHDKVFDILFSCV